LQKKGFVRFMRSGVILVLCACLTFPLCFSAARYLPPVFHHPVWFWGEWAESKVHSWDKWDSEKFVDIDEFMDAALGRIVDSVTDLLGYSPTVMRVQAMEVQPAQAEGMETQAEVVQNASTQESALTYEQFEDSYLVRKTIYQHYISRLNLLGQPYEEQGFRMTPTYWIGHAHNIFLQYGTDFGIPVMIMFAVLIVWAAICFTRRIYKGCNEVWVGSLLFLLVPAVFGMLEYSWGVGSVTILLLFVVWRKVICEEG